MGNEHKIEVYDLKSDYESQIEELVKFYGVEYKVKDQIQKKMTTEIEDHKRNNLQILNILKTPRLYDKYKNMMQNQNEGKEGQAYVIKMRK